jgi:hypothetical protein
VADALLTPPANWTTAARALPVEELVLSQYPHHHPSLPAGRTWEDITRDLGRGTWLVRDRTARYEAFRLGGEEFELRVLRKAAKDAAARGETVWLAVVDRVEAARSVPPKAHWLRPASVLVEWIYDEVGCDIAELEARVVERERHLSRPHGRSRGADRHGSHGELQRAVSKEYGELGTLIELLAERPVPPEAEVTGLVAPSSRAGMVTVSTGDRLLVAFQRQRVRLTAPSGRAFHTQVTSAGRGRLEIAEPRDWQLSPGSGVTVSVVPPFGMRQNGEALRDFRSGNVEGSWDDLARLLCKPTSLTPLPGTRPGLTFYSDHDLDPRVPRLNDEQRKAVEGAVSSPHAFLIQGPPGTGKTEVISEVIRQLTGRGERVLLLAPSHVAVDEALARVGHKPGVRPLRITFSDDKVRESLRVFLPENVGIDTASRVLRAADSGQGSRWEQERRETTEALELLRDLSEAESRSLAATENLRVASAEASQLDGRLRARRADAEAEIADLGREVATAAAALAQSDAAAASAKQEVQEARQRLEPPLAAIRSAAVTIIRHGEAAIRAWNAERHAADEYNAWLAASHLARLEVAARDRTEAEAALPGARETARRAWTAASALRARLEAAKPPENALCRLASRVGLGTYADLQRTLAKAEATFAAAQADLAARDAELRAAMAAHDQLAARVAADQDRLESARRRQAEARQVAERDFTASLEAFIMAFRGAAPGLASPGGGTEISQWTRLGRIVHARISAVLPPVPGVSSIDPPANWDSATGWEAAWDQALYPYLDELTAAATRRQQFASRRDELHRHREDLAGRLRQAQTWAGAEIERLGNESQAAQVTLEQCRAALQNAIEERDELAGAVRARGYADEATLERRHHVLGQLSGLADRWRQLVTERTDAQLVEDIQQSIVRATNLVCATTKGIVGRGSQLVRHADYDTLIVDEASRVTESEFLIGAVRARRWVLVGDEHQLPPHVDTDDEHFLHALTALHRVASGRSPSLEEAVREVGELWKEDEELRKFRDEPVQELAGHLDSSGDWQQVFANRFTGAHQRFTANKGEDADTDKALLGAMIRYLVQSLFQRAVTRVDDSLKQPLVWQRRMIAPLAQVVNVPIYSGRYKSPSDEELAEAGVTPLVTSTNFTAPCVFVDTSHYKDAAETPDNHGFYNKREISLVTRICEIYNAELAERADAAPVSTSVLTFYSAQARRLERALMPRTDLPMLHWQVIDVIDRIQGQQSELVIVSFARARPGYFSGRFAQWLMDTRRLNVACTRARRALVLVGHADTLQRLGGSSPQDRQAQRARQFYQNLFTLLESDEHFMRKVHL